MAATVGGIHLIGDHASRPSSGIPYDALYSCTDHVKIYKTTDGGGTWIDYIDPADATPGTHSHSGADITSGTVAEARIHADIARDSEVTSAVSTHESDTSSVHGITDTSTLYRSGGTDVAVADGGTGASSASSARTNLGLVIGTDVKAQNPTSISPAQLTSNTNDWNPTGLATADIIRVSTDASRNLTGIDDPAGGEQTLVIANVGSFDLVLKHQSASSSAANRIICPNDTDLTLQKDSAIVLVYDNTTDRWRVIGGTGSGGGGGTVTVTDVSGSVSVAADTIKFPDGTVTDLGSGDASIRQVPVGFIGAKAYHSTTQSITSGVETAAAMDSEVYDSDGFHSTSANTSRFTVPAGMGGKYRLIGYTQMAGGTNPKYVWWRLNGGAGTYIRGSYVNNASTGTLHGQTSIVDVDLAAGDYVECFVYQSSGGAVNIGGASDYQQTACSIEKLDAGRVGSGVGAKAYNSGVQSISASTLTALTLDSEEWDTDAFHSTSANTSRMTIPAGLGGKYLVVAGTRVPGTGWSIAIGVNGTRVRNQTGAIANGADADIQTVAIVDVAAGDYIEALTFDATGGNVGHASAAVAQTHLSIARHDSQGADKVRTAKATRTSGNITINGTSWANLDTGLDLSLSASVGDQIEVGLSGTWNNEAVNAGLDAVSLVSGSPVNSLATGAAPDNANHGVAAWFGTTGVAVAIGGSVLYTLQSGDISGGTVTIRFRYRTLTAANKSLNAVSALPLHVWARNWGQ